jgi:ribosomal protein L13E
MPYMERQKRVGARGSGPHKDPPTAADIALSRLLDGKVSPWTLQDYRRLRWLPTVPVAPLPGAGGRRPVVYADTALAVASIITHTIHHASKGRRVSRGSAVLAAASITCAVPLEGVSSAYRQDWEGAARRMRIGKDFSADDDQAESAAGVIVDLASKTRMGRRIRRNLAYDIVDGDALLTDAIAGVMRPVFFGLPPDRRSLRRVLAALNMPEGMIDAGWLGGTLLDLGRGLSPDRVDQMLRETTTDEFARAVVLARRAIRVFNYRLKKDLGRRNVLTHEQVFDAHAVALIAILLLALPRVGIGTMELFAELVTAKEPNRRFHEWVAVAARLQRGPALTPQQ